MSEKEKLLQCLEFIACHDIYTTPQIIIKHLAITTLEEYKKEKEVIKNDIK